MAWLLTNFGSHTNANYYTRPQLTGSHASRRLFMLWSCQVCRSVLATRQSACTTRLSMNPVRRKWPIFSYSRRTKVLDMES